MIRTMPAWCHSDEAQLRNAPPGSADAALTPLCSSRAGADRSNAGPRRSRLPNATAGCTRADSSPDHVLCRLGLGRRFIFAMPPLAASADARCPVSPAPKPTRCSARCLHTYTRNSRALSTSSASAPSAASRALHTSRASHSASSNFPLIASAAARLARTLTVSG